MNFCPQVIHLRDVAETLNVASTLKERLWQEKLIILRPKVQLSASEFELFCLNVAGEKEADCAFISWDFGHVMDLKNQRDSENYIFSLEEVPLHWDGAFYQVPAILAFQCLKNTYQGGETYFSDTQLVFSSLSKKERMLLEGLRLGYVTEKKAHYGGRIEQQVVENHAITGQKILRLGEKVKSQKNPVDRFFINDWGIKAQALLEKVEKKLRSKRCLYAHQWQEGDLVLADNYALLHGRSALFQKITGERHLRRIQLR